MAPRSIKLRNNKPKADSTARVRHTVTSSEDHWYPIYGGRSALLRCSYKQCSRSGAALALIDGYQDDSHTSTNQQRTLGHRQRQPRGRMVALVAVLVINNVLLPNVLPEGRIGEASNPGPLTHHRLDDPEFDTQAEDEDSAPMSPQGPVFMDLSQNEREALDNDCEFIAAVGFVGPKPGMFFSKGPRGLGYYKDGPKTISIADAIDWSATCQRGISLNDVDQLQRLVTTLSWPSPESASPVRRNVSLHTALCSDVPTAKPVRSKGPLSWWPGRSTKPHDHADGMFEASLCAGCWPHPIRKGLEASSNLHVELGLWAVDTFNANAWNSLFEYLRRTSADAVVGQETKLFAGDSVSSAESSLSTNGWRGRVEPCNRGPAGGASAGTLVTAKRCIGLSQPLCGQIEGKGRFQMQHVGAVCRGGLHLGSVYLVDKVGPASPQNLAILDMIAEYLRLLHGPWILGG